MNMNIDVREVPFSRRGSYFAVSYLAHSKALFIRDVHGGDMSPSELFEIVFEDLGHSDIDCKSFQENYEIKVSETKFEVCSLVDKEQYLKIIIPQGDELRIKVNGLKINLRAHKTRYDTFNQMKRNEYEYIAYKKESKFMFRFLDDNFKVDAPWKIVGNSKIEIHIDASKRKQELVIYNYKVVPSRALLVQDTFEQALQKIEVEYEAWLESTLKTSVVYDGAARLAKYIIWSSIVSAEGLLPYDSVYMSKNRMQNIWSWDNCFNAMALTKTDKYLAYHQFLIFVEHQDKSGAYPDFINDVFKSYNCLKPPIHAWAYQKMMDDDKFFSQRSQLEPLYLSISKSTKFWLEYRLSSLGLPFYTHGNDSGWDNASIFHDGLPVIAPDLSSYLVQQMDILASWAKILEYDTEAEYWTKKADELFALLMKHLYVDDHFVARKLYDFEIIKEFDSLILQLPLVIAYRLEQKVVDGLKRNLETRFESEFGLCTESLSSDKFKSDGYWLGPIWAPESFIFFDAISRINEDAFSDRIATKYCELGSVGGMAENYNPLTGTGNDDLSFTWTSSVYLMLANHLHRKNINE